jgi:hypothetical protein
MCVCSFGEGATVMSIDDNGTCKVITLAGQIAIQIHTSGLMRLEPFHSPSFAGGVHQTIDPQVEIA